MYYYKPLKQYSSRDTITLMDEVWQCGLTSAPEKKGSFYARAV
jgi:hypothetical protein